MVITILEAIVAPDREADLLAAFEDAGRGEIEEGLQRSYLARKASDPGTWRILTSWRTREDLQRMRESGETPRGVLIFRAAGAAPTLEVWEVAATITADSSD